MNNRDKKLLAALSLLSLLPGCASFTHDTTQLVQIETYSRDNQPVNGARCIAQNERGSWPATAPGGVSVHRSSQNLIVNCEKEGEAAGKGTLISRANAGMFGNIVLGGGIGALIDHNKGTAYTYPSWIRIIMGDNLVFDRRNEAENTPMTGSSVTVNAKTPEASPSASPSATAQVSP